MRKTIGIIGSFQEIDGNTSQRAAMIYPRVVGRMLEATPLIIPSVPEVQDIGHLVEILDGILLTGHRANVHPSYWGEEATEAHGTFDQGRDAVAIPLVRAAVDAGLPLFGSCRGFQEMAAAYGSAMHPEIRDLPGRMNHRMPRDRELTREEVFRPRHRVNLCPGGIFAEMYGATEITVNSLHGQGITVAGERVVIEGRAEDSTPEAITIRGAAGFALGVQWHGEFDPWDQPVNAVLWHAFRDAIEA